MYYLNQYVSKKLATTGGIDSSQTTGIILSDTTGLELSKPGIACLSYSDPIDTDKAEWITYTSIDSTTKEFQGVTRGQEGYSAKAHANGVTIAFPISKSHVNDINKALSVDGLGVTHMTQVLDEDDMASDSATSLATQQSIKAYVDTYGQYDSLYRNAIINGNFDIWQRGTSSSVSGEYLADRWRVDTNGTTFTQSQETTDVPSGSKYAHKCVVDLADTQILDRRYRIEGKDAAKLSGKTVTLSFLHKDSVTAGTNEIYVYLGYASAEDDFTTVENVTLESNIAITSSYTRKSITFTIASTSPTNGYSASNGLEILIRHKQSVATGTLTSRLVQVQLNAGSIALPYQPRSYADELRLCQRYYEKSYDIETAIGTNTGVGLFVSQSAEAVSASTSGAITITNPQFLVTKRAIPTTKLYARDGTANAITINVGTVRSGCTTAETSTRYAFRYISIDNSSSNAISINDRIMLHWTADAEL